MDRIKQLTTAAISTADSIGSPVLTETVELLVAAIDELTDALTADEDYLDEMGLEWGRAEMTE